MATSAYMSWLQKRESKVSRSPSTPAEIERSESEKQEGGAYTSWLQWRERQIPPLDAEASIAPERGGLDSSPRVRKAGKRARSWGNVRKDLDTVSLADEFALKRRKRIAAASKGAKSVEIRVPTTNAKSSAPRSSSLPGKRKLEASVQGEEPRKVRRVATEECANHSLSSADDEMTQCVADPATEKDTQHDPDGPQSKKTVALLVAECRYWTAVDRFSHLN